MSHTLRLAHFDLLKLLACFGVICVHIGMSVSEPSLKLIARYISGFGGFAVPIFFMLSGYFLKEDAHLHHKDFLQKLFIRLFIPFVVFALFYNILFALDEPYSFKKIIGLIWFGGQAFHLWFLPTLFITTLIFLSLRSVLSVKMLILIGFITYALSVAFLYFASAFIALDDPMDVVQIIRSSPLNSFYFFALGAYLKNHTEKSVMKPFYLFLIVIASFCTFMMEIHIRESASSFYLTTDMKFSLLIFVPALFLTFNTISMPSSLDWMATLGRYSLGIFLIHLFWLHVFRKGGAFVDFNLILAFILMILTPFLILVLSYLSARILALFPYGHFLTR